MVSLGGYLKYNLLDIALVGPCRLLLLMQEKEHEFLWHFNRKALWLFLLERMKEGTDKAVTRREELSCIQHFRWWRFLLIHTCLFMSLYSIWEWGHFCLKVAGSSNRAAGFRGFGVVASLDSAHTVSVSSLHFTFILYWYANNFDSYT